MRATACLGQASPPDQIKGPNEEVESGRIPLSTFSRLDHPLRSYQPPVISCTDWPLLRTWAEATDAEPSKAIATRASPKNFVIVISYLSLHAGWRVTLW
jgi:hypothetical protein